MFHGTGELLYGDEVQRLTAEQEALLLSFMQVYYEGLAEFPPSALPHFLRIKSRQSLMKRLWNSRLDCEVCSVNVEEVTAEHSYDREAAVAYADRYVTLRNPEWQDYGRSGRGSGGLSGTLQYVKYEKLSCQSLRVSLSEPDENHRMECLTKSSNCA